MNDITIENMSMDHYDEVYALWSEAKGVYISDSDSQKNIRKYLKRNPGMSFVAKSKGAIAGAVLCGHDGRRGHIYHLAVALSFRRQGIAKMLLNHCLYALRQKGISMCRAITMGDNKEGQEFWKAMGWSERDNIVFRIVTKGEQAE